MAVTIKRVTVWRREVENQPGMLASTLEPLASAGADLRLVMGYRFADGARAAIEVYPISGKRMVAAAEQAGLKPLDLACLLVDGEDRPALAARIGRALADANINLAFIVAQVIGRRWSGVFGFADEATASSAGRVIKLAVRPARQRARAA